jgi:penicillin-binding protein 2
LPDDKPVRYTADTIMASIGHGNFSTTLLNMAIMLCRLVTNKKVTPRLIKNNLEKFESLNMNLKDMDFIVNAMYNTFNSSTGTGRGYKEYLKDVEILGKTTTTQVIQVKRDADGKVLPNQFRDWKDRDHSMCCCAFDLFGEKYVLAVLIEHGGWGRYSAQLCSKIIQEIYNKKSGDKNVLY